MEEHTRRRRHLLSPVFTVPVLAVTNFAFLLPTRILSLRHGYAGAVVLALSLLVTKCVHGKELALPDFTVYHTMATLASLTTVSRQVPSLILRAKRAEEPALVASSTSFLFELKNTPVD